MREPGHLPEDFPLETLPGGTLVRKGLEDLVQQKHTVASLLLMIGGPRLRSMGFPVPKTLESPEHLLYDLLAQSDPDSAHSRYNAFIHLLVSFERAAECVMSSKKSASASS